MENLAFTVDIIGKVMIAYTALAVHNRVRKDHKIDKDVFRTMKHEKIIGILGIVLMIAGYIIHISI